MSKFPAFVAATAMSLVLTAPVFAEDMTANTVVATVDGIEITLGHMIITRAQLPEQYQSLPADVLFGGILDQLTQQAVLAASLEADPNRVTLAIENELRSLRAGEVITALTEGAVTDEAIQALYDETFAEAEASIEFNASHILVETEEEAATIIEEIAAGADFAETAAEKSTGPSGPNGGQLGWFGEGMMVEPFEAAVVEMEVGDISAPVETQFGWHVIILNETREQAPPAIEELRPQLEAQLQNNAIEAAIADLTAAAEITLPEEGAFDPALLNDLDLLEQ